MKIVINKSEISKAISHKYKSKKADGKGGWVYEYNETETKKLPSLNEISNKLKEIGLKKVIEGKDGGDYVAVKVHNGKKIFIDTFDNEEKSKMIANHLKDFGARFEKSKNGNGWVAVFIGGEQKEEEIPETQIKIGGKDFDSKEVDGIFIPIYLSEFVDKLNEIQKESIKYKKEVDYKKTGGSMVVRAGIRIPVYREGKKRDVYLVNQFDQADSTNYAITKPILDYIKKKYPELNAYYDHGNMD